MPAFVILYHEMPNDHARGSHWDFMLQVGDRLRTWALAQQPRAGVAIEAILLDDHRLDYLHYEGPVSGGRGIVSQWDRGAYTPLESDEQQWNVELRGQRLVGLAQLRRDATKRNDQCWLFSFTGLSAAT